MSNIRPIFLLSLPRSGSTLLQRLLMANPAVASRPEPWLLLPVFYARRPAGHKAEYWGKTASTAINEFIAALPAGDDDFYTAVNQFATGLYGKAADDGATYFLDKTPRYHLIVDELMRAFPDARFVFLWRNPLAIIASIIQTWGGGRWNLPLFEIDLVRGMRNLMAGFRTYGERSIAIGYEALVSSPSEQLGRLWAYLDVESNGDEIESFGAVDIAGAMGDPTGTADYDGLATEPLGKWKTVLNNPLRKAWCRRYLKSFGAEDWALIGYDRAAMLSELDGVGSTTHHLLSDLRRLAWPGQG